MMMNPMPVAPGYPGAPGLPRPATQPLPPRYAAPQQPAVAARPTAAPPSPAPAPAQPAPRLIVRAQAPDEPAPAPRPQALSLPSPEALGIAPTPRAGTESVDWAAAHRRLERLGATCFHLERLSTGGCRITCLLPGRQQGRHHRVESLAPTEAEALRLALERADQWVAQR